MIMGEYWQLHDEAALQRIDRAAIHLLTACGARIKHAGLLSMLEEAGCRIDWPAERCYFREALIRQAVAHLGKPQRHSVTIPTGWQRHHSLGHSGSFPHLLEWPKGQRRLATQQDIREMAKMAQMLDEFCSVGRVLTCAEVDPRIEPLWTTMQLAAITDKPIAGGEILYPQYIEPLVRMGEVLSGVPGDTSLIAPCDFFIAPLIFDQQQAACFLEKRKFGLPNVPGTMPISGLSAPVTIAGAVTLAVAELLAGWVMGYVVSPEAPASGIVASGSIDLRATTACFGSPEALLQDLATTQLCRRLYGIAITPATGYTDCTKPGIEAVFLKMLPLLMIPFGVAPEFCCSGLLSAGQDYSPVQQLLELEMQEAMQRFWGTFDVNDETIALEVIEETMRHAATNFLETDHTLAHYRTEQWYPRLFKRLPWQGTAAELQDEPALLERINQRVTDAIHRYERPELDSAKLAEIRRIYAGAERDILGGHVTDA